jgi:hypothetical protein
MIEGVSTADYSTLLSLGSLRPKAICAVYSWIVLDIEGGDHRADMTATNLGGLKRCNAGTADSKPGLLPLVLFAHFVERDSANRFEHGVSIRTGYAIDHDGRGIFETEDTFYLLLGKGFRRSIPSDVIGAIPEGLVSEDYSIDRQARRRGIAALSRSSSTVHCDVQMSTAQAQAFLALVRTLRFSGQHGMLESVFCDIEREIGPSVAYLPSA